MGIRFRMMLFLALVMVAESSSMYSDAGWDTISRVNLNALRSNGMSTACNGQVGDCIDQAEEMMMDSEASRTTLAENQRFSGYKAFDRTHIPCNQRGQSYYSCNQKARAYS